MFTTKINSAKVDMRMTQKLNGGGSLCATINNNIALPMFRNLKITAPVFRGYLQRDIMMEVNNGSNNSTTWIRFPTRDPEKGHPYVHYAEFGRSAISGKYHPKMRYWRSPAGNVNTNKDIVVTPNVRKAKQSFFIRNTMVEYKPLAVGIAQAEVKRWLMM